MPSVATNLCQAKASYKKVPGLLELTTTHIQWTQTGKSAPGLRVPNSQVASLFCSKEGSPQVKLKLGLVGDDAGHTFQFLAAAAVASQEREAFKRELTNIISQNRTNSTHPPVATPVPALVAAKGITPAPSPGPSSPRPPVPSSRAASVSSNGRSTSVGPSGSIDDFQVRKRVLMKNPELANLHRELVMSGQITENEFWEGRESLLLAEVAHERQKRGKSGQLVDPRPQTTATGDIKITVTPQLVHDIFEEFPVVAKAYSETVPKKLSEEQFWMRYFQSRLFHSHRASIRSSATQHVIKDDPIFDKYVEKQDDELEPRHQKDGNVDLFINLHATEEDHVDTGNQADVTMQAGKQRSALPLIRRFNEHSERLLNSAMGDPAEKRRRINESGESVPSNYNDIDLDDLHDPGSSDGIQLEMQDRDRYFLGRAATAVSAEASEAKPALSSMVANVQSQMESWSSDLSHLKMDRPVCDGALQAMTHNVRSRLEVKTRKNDIPAGLFRQMTTCQTAANEFLRQYWLAIYPSFADLATAGQASPAQRSVKANKMAGYLSKTHEKVDALVQAAQKMGSDPERVKVAMKPVLDAVDKALQHNRNRKQPR